MIEIDNKKMWESILGKEQAINSIWHSAYELSEDVKKNKGYYHVLERLCLCVNHKGDAAIGWIEVDGSDVACCSPHLISTWLLANVYYYAYIDELFPQKLADEITRNIMNDKSY